MNAEIKKYTAWGAVVIHCQTTWKGRLHSERSQHTGCTNALGEKSAPKCIKAEYGAWSCLEATRMPDEITLAVTQSFSSQLSGFFSLLLLKRCFEIWLPFEVSRVQHDIYLRYKPNPFAFQIPSALPCRTHRSPFPGSLIPFPRCERSIKEVPGPGCLLSLRGAGGARAPSASGGALWKAGFGGGGEVPAAEEAECWVTPAPLSRKARRLSISRRLWQRPGRRSSPCVRAGEPHCPMKYFIITTAVKYWWLLASAECFSRRLSLRVMEPNSSL